MQKLKASNETKAHELSRLGCGAFGGLFKNESKVNQI